MPENKKLTALINDETYIKPIEDGDIEQMQLWLNKPHVLKWYHDADEWLCEAIRETFFISYRFYTNFLYPFAL